MAGHGLAQPVEIHFRAVNEAGEEIDEKQPVQPCGHEILDRLFMHQPVDLIFHMQRMACLHDRATADNGTVRCHDPREGFEADFLTVTVDHRLQKTDQPLLIEIFREPQMFGNSVDLTDAAETKLNLLHRRHGVRRNNGDLQRCRVDLGDDFLSGAVPRSSPMTRSPPCRKVQRYGKAAGRPAVRNSPASGPLAMSQ